MAPEFVSVLQADFFFIELVMYKRICAAIISGCPSNYEKWDSNDNSLTWYYGIVFWKGSEEILSIYFLCLLSGLMLMQDSTLLLNTTDNDVRKA